MTVAHKYANDVVSGKIITGKWIQLAAKKFLSDCDKEDRIFNDVEAQRAVNFVQKRLKHWEGSFAGMDLLLEPWQQFIIMQVFGWYGLTGRRLIRSVYIQVARKNGKTAFLAAIILYHVFADRENTPQVLVGANNEDQAKICTNSVGQMVLSSPALREMYNDKEINLFTYKGKVFGLEYPERTGEVRAISKNPETKDGFNPSLGGIDEYHEAKNDLLLNVIESGQGSRRQPLLAVITTAGFDTSGPCFSKLRDSSIKQLQNIQEDDHHLSFIYEQDEGDSEGDESTWVKSNPNLDVSVSLEFLRSRYNKAKNEGGTKMVDFLTKNLNRWCDSPAVWIGSEDWAKNKFGNNIHTLPAHCYAGLDLARTVDINAFCMWFPSAYGDKHAVLPLFWIPESKLKDNEDKVDYRKWSEDGFIKVTDGNVADYDVISQDITAACIKYGVKSIAYDPYLAGHGVLKNLLAAGIECHDLRQGTVTLNMPTRELERLALSGNIEHFGNPVLAWMMSNVVIAKDSSGNIKPDKGKSTKKIDGVAAMINALAEWKTFENKSTYSGMFFIEDNNPNF